MYAKTIHLGRLKVRSRWSAVLAAITLLLGLAAEETLRIGRAGNPSKFPGQILFPVALALHCQMVVVAMLL